MPTVFTPLHRMTRVTVVMAHVFMRVSIPLAEPKAFEHAALLMQACDRSLPGLCACPIDKGGRAHGYTHMFYLKPFTCPGEQTASDPVNNKVEAAQSWLSARGITPP